jgi:hypothetical protein
MKYVLITFKLNHNSQDNYNLYNINNIYLGMYKIYNTYLIKTAICCYKNCNYSINSIIRKTP